MDAVAKPSHLILNSPFEEPSRYWEYVRETLSFRIAEGRRKSGYTMATPNAKGFDDPGVFKEIPLVNAIRPRVNAWRIAGWPGVTGMTRRLLEHWYDETARDGRRFFFCQMEAMETLIWLSEADPAERVGLDIPGDGGDWERQCCKMATGTGKTLVMAMVLAWQFLNKASYPQDIRFAKHALIMAPGITVRSRLGVLLPDSEGNYYELFQIVPGPLMEMLRQGKVIIRNWQALAWDTPEKIAKRRRVDKRGAKSDEAYCREVLGELAAQRNLLVLNDEAHHAWRIPAEFKGRREDKELFDESTVWVGGLDRIHRARGIARCYDFSATPFAPSGKQSYEEALFGWIVSDFGLNDAIESGLVKTPRVVVRDDSGNYSQDYKSRLFHIYADPEVNANVTRAAEPQDPLPDLVMNAYYLLGRDWLETRQKWEEAGSPTPPVMITVTNRTETAARIKFAFDRKKVLIEELCDSSRILHIDSKVLREAESSEEVELPEAQEGGDEADETATPKLTKKQQAELLRQTVDTVGQPGRPGAMVQNVISVGMLSEGWDAKTVTHIMGLRAFSSQLLCEQVVGRGLRRTSYELNKDGKFDPEYVNIFGVPFTFIPHEDPGDIKPRPPIPTTRVELLKERHVLDIEWPNVIRIDHEYRPRLYADFRKMKPLVLDAYKTVQLAKLAPMVAGKPNLDQITEVDLEALAKKFRWQRVVFEVVRDLFDQFTKSWKGSKESLVGQLVGITERYLDSGLVRVDPPLFYQDPLRQRIVYTLNLSRVVRHLFKELQCANTEQIVPVLDSRNPVRRVGDMLPWYTSRPCFKTQKSLINVVVLDSKWEGSEAFHLDHSDLVHSWAKNDHLGFEVFYTFNGVVHRYRPDYLVKLASGEHLIVEVKGVVDDKALAKKSAAEEWTEAVTAIEQFGRWRYVLCDKPQKILDALHASRGRDTALGRTSFSLMVKRPPAYFQIFAMG